MMRHLVFVRQSLIVGFLGGFLGCGGGTAEVDRIGPPASEREWDAKYAQESQSAAKPVEKAAPKPSAEPRARVTEAIILRSDILPVLEGGLGRFLQNVEMEAVFSDRRFVGFRLRRFFPGNATVAMVDMGPGDIVTSVNSSPIERPEQALQVWESLRTANELRVEYLRGDDVRQLVFEIRD
ncbi:MAG: hypothetical protein KC416_01915 [Myxococcales bacterium]|nr:hypothetical protein [Myxococcales bacterium]